MVIEPLGKCLIYLQSALKQPSPTVHALSRSLLICASIVHESKHLEKIEQVCKINLTARIIEFAYEILKKE